MNVDAPLAILAPAYPVLSETFVRRDVEGLRAGGKSVLALGLRPGDPQVSHAVADHVVYSGLAGWASTLAELVRHPWRALCTLAGAGRDAVLPAEPLSISGRAKLGLQALAGLGLARWLRARGVVHLHCHFAHAPTSVGMYAARQAGIPFSFVGHANDLFQRRQLLRRKLERASFVACISHWHRRFYIDVDPACSERLRIVRCGVNVDDWEVPSRVHEGDSPVRVLSVARLVEKKGVDTLLSALASVPSEKSDALRLVVVGDGPLADDLRLAGVRQGVDALIEWRGAQPGEVVRALMGECAIFALPCRVSESGDMDGIPVVFMEAMACGMPVVAGDLPAIRELVEDGVTGLLVQGGDVASVSASLVRLAGDAGLRARLGGAGRARVQEEFSAQVNLRRLVEAIDQLGAGRSPE